MKIIQEKNHKGKHLFSQNKYSYICFANYNIARALSGDICFKIRNITQFNDIVENVRSGKFINGSILIKVKNFSALDKVDLLFLLRNKVSDKVILNLDSSKEFRKFLDYGFWKEFDIQVLTKREVEIDNPVFKDIKVGSYVYKDFESGNFICKNKGV